MRKREYGGAALEYLMVSTFAAVVAIAALGFLGTVVKEQLTKLGDRLGVEADPDLDLDVFGGGE